MTTATGAPFRMNCSPSITMFGTIRMTTADLTSRTRLRRGVPSTGKPKPMEPLTNAAAITAAAARTAVMRGQVSQSNIRTKMYECET